MNAENQNAFAFDFRHHPLDEVFAEALLVTPIEPLLDVLRLEASRIGVAHGPAQRRGTRAGADSRDRPQVYGRPDLSVALSEQRTHRLDGITPFRIEPDVLVRPKP